MGKRIAEDVSRLDGLARALRSLSPQRTLERGYAVVTRAGERREALRDARPVAAGSRVHAQLAEGALECTVDAVTEGSLTGSPTPDPHRWEPGE